MVGFGSSLRMARRSGWDAAYFDYESLKLLITQIESVYEEEWHRQQTSAFALGGSDTDTSPPSRNKAQRKRGAADYRDELFLESDSDVAFASSACDVFPDELVSSDDETQRHVRSDSGTTGSARPFALTYSHEDSSSDIDDSSVDLEGSCATALGWRRDTNKLSGNASAMPTKKTKKKHKRRILETLGSDSEFYVNTGPTSFLMEDGGGDTATTTTTSSVFAQTAYGASLGHPSEQSRLLPQSHPVPSQAATFFSFHSSRDASVTPPREFSGTTQYPQLSAGAIANSSQQAQSSSVRPRASAAETRREKLDQERKRKRRQRRRRRLAKKRQELERRVPRHLRNAHKKARSITERFLGLLRAEVEKVTLFAQSRLGELADTAGSLRFPSYEDSEYGSFSSNSRRRVVPASYDHPLSDGGRHPSASSSEDEGHGDPRSVFPWSESSDEGETSDSVTQSNRSPNAYAQSIEKNYSGGTLMSAATVRRSNAPLVSTVARQDSGGTKKARNAALDAVQRKITHYTSVRRARPVFQRNDDIVGEDLLLLSAVDEADGYTTVGVELMHVLRYICVNLIAVRKICRKHDRLLMNRMLGGYYHRKHARKTTKKVSATYAGSNTSLTMGSVVCRSVGEDYRVDPASVSTMNQNKLVGVYDREIQELANSTTVQVISSCLALALSEYEVSRTRADALSKLKSVRSTLKTPRRSGATKPEAADSQGMFGSFALTPSQWLPTTKKEDPSGEADVQVDSDYEGGGGPPSTASSVSLTRLRFAVMSIFALREAARAKLNIHHSFLSRSMLVFVGPNIAGEGLDGCSRAVLDFFVSYNPDSALLRDSSDIYEGLHEENWRQEPIGSVMLSVLAVGVSPAPLDYSAAGDAVLSALSIQPAAASKPGGIAGTLNDQVAAFLVNSKLSIVPSISADVIRANRFGSLLQTTNYFVIHATANTFVMLAKARPAHSPILIGATSLGSLVAASFHAHRMASERISGNFIRGFYRYALLIAALLSALGNAVYIVAVTKSSVPLAVLGRLIVGFGSADILYRQLTGCLPAPCIMVESARLVNAQTLGVVLGLVLGAVSGVVGLDDAPSGPSLVLASYLMAGLWLVQFGYIVFVLFRKADHEDIFPRKNVRAISTGSPDDAFSSDDSDVAVENSRKLIHRSQELTRDDTKASFSAEDARIPLSYSPPNFGSRKRSMFHGLKVTTNRLRKYMMSNIALPVTLFLVALATLSHEILFTSCAIITDRYFGWNGSHAGFFLGCLSASVFMISNVCGSIANAYDERTVMKRSVVIVGIGFVVMINYSSLFSLAFQVPSLLDETTSRQPVSYDWIIGVLQYVFGFGIAFTGFIAMEGASLALMSKVAPTNVRSAVINCGTIVTFATLTARLIGDLQICMVGLSHRIINTDLVNSLVVPLILACVAAAYVVKRHFFFLI